MKQLEDCTISIPEEETPGEAKNNKMSSKNKSDKVNGDVSNAAFAFVSEMQ